MTSETDLPQLPLPGCGWTPPPDAATLAQWIGATGASASALHARADALRRAVHGDAVFLRGIIEISNACRNRCAYCGINVTIRSVERYRMSEDEVLETARLAQRWGCTTLVLQSGDDPGCQAGTLARTVGRIRGETGLAVTLSIGVRSRADLRVLRDAGAERYLLRFETSDPELFGRIHPDESFERRIECLRDLRELGFQVGSGFMIGLPDWTPATIAGDLRFATALDLDMIGCGPFLAHPETPLAGVGSPVDAVTAYNTIALLRLCNPRAHIPATTAFDALAGDGRNRVLQCGANIFMPNLTPARYRKLYQLYPNKPCVDEDGEACALCVRGRLAALGREVGLGPGHALRNEPSTDAVQRG